MKRGNLLFILALIIIAGMILSCKVRVDHQASEAAKEHVWSDEPSNTQSINATTLQAAQKEFTELAKRLNPAVVNISTETTIKFERPQFRGMPNGQGMPDNDLFNKFFEEFFGPDNMFPRNQKTQSLGSGFVINEDGLIITNHHVVERADEIWVSFSEGDDAKRYKAKVVGSDKKTDIALIKIKADKKLQVAPLGDSDSVEVGSIVLAIGNPFGHGHTVTMGIISAKERILPAGMFSPYTDYLQTDASINPGNSGGPLINIKGEVIGIATAIDVRAQGIGFAIPITIAKQLLPELKESGKISRGWLGVGIDKLNDDLRKHLKLSKDINGVIVTEVFPGDPADKAGMKPYDVIYEFNGNPITSGRDLVAKVGLAKKDSYATVKAYRDGKSQTFKVKLVERKDEDEDKETTQKKSPDKKDESSKIGISAENINSRMVQLFSLKVTKGVVITEVDRNSVAYEAELRAGDVILEADQKKINNITELNSALGKLSPGNSVLLRVQRDDVKRVLILSIPKEEKKE